MAITTLLEHEVAQTTLTDKSRTALSVNGVYLLQPAIPASPTNAQLVAAVKTLRGQVDALTRQNNALIRLETGLIEDQSDT